MTVRLSVVRYLNTKPLVYGLEQGLVPHRFSLSYDVPSVCASRVKSGEADLGLIPSIEFARLPTPGAIIPTIAIASYGPVASIFLYHRVPLESIRTVALDTSSRTSVALTHILLKDRYGVDFTPMEQEPILDNMLAVADAALIIGDPALESVDRPEPRLDLGQAWTELTGLPFVYAFWAGQPDAVSPGDIRALIASKATGLANLDTITKQYARTHARSAAFYLSYLKDHLYFELGTRELQGLTEFYRRAFRLGLIETEAILRFFPT